MRTDGKRGHLSASGPQLPLPCALNPSSTNSSVESLASSARSPRLPLHRHGESAASSGAFTAATKEATFSAARVRRISNGQCRSRTRRQRHRRERYWKSRHRNLEGVNERSSISMGGATQGLSNTSRSTDASLSSYAGLRARQEEQQRWHA